MRDTKREREKIIQEIKNVFADVPYPGDERLVTTLNHFEADEIIEDFKGKSWKEISLELAYKYRLSLPVFTPEAFRFYLPGLLITALQAPATSKYNPGEILEFIFYNLVPTGRTAHEMALIDDFTSQQKMSLSKFVWFFIETNTKHNEIYRDKAIELWKR